MALAREAKLWEDTCDYQGKRWVKCRIQHRPPPEEVGKEKLLPWLHRTPLNWPRGDRNCDIPAKAAMHHATSAQVQNAGIWRTEAFPTQQANYTCSENTYFILLVTSTHQKRQKVTKSWVPEMAKLDVFDWYYTDKSMFRNTNVDQSWALRRRMLHTLRDTTGTNISECSLDLLSL